MRVQAKVTVAQFPILISNKWKQPVQVKVVVVVNKVNEQSGAERSER